MNFYTITSNSHVFFFLRFLQVELQCKLVRKTLFTWSVYFLLPLSCSHSFCHRAGAVFRSSAVSSAGGFCPKAGCPSLTVPNPTPSASILLIFDRTNVLWTLLLPVTFILSQISISLQIGPSITTTSIYILDFSSAAALLKYFDLRQVPKSSFVKSCSFRSSGINSFLCEM